MIIFPMSGGANLWGLEHPLGGAAGQAQRRRVRDAVVGCAGCCWCTCSASLPHLDVFGRVITTRARKYVVASPSLARSPERTIPNVDGRRGAAVGIRRLRTGRSPYIAFAGEKGPQDAVALPFVLAGIFIIGLALTLTLRTIKYRSLVLHHAAGRGGRAGGGRSTATGLLREGMSVGSVAAGADERLLRRHDVGGHGRTVRRDGALPLRRAVRVELTGDEMTGA